MLTNASSDAPWSVLPDMVEFFDVVEMPCEPGLFSALWPYSMRA